MNASTGCLGGRARSWTGRVVRDLKRVTRVIGRQVWDEQQGLTAPPLLVIHRDVASSNLGHGFSWIGVLIPTKRQLITLSRIYEGDGGRGAPAELLNVRFGGRGAVEG